MTPTKIVLLLLNLIWFTSFSLQAQENLGFQVDFSKSTYTINDDYTYVAIVEQQGTVLTAKGLSALQKNGQDFYPTSQKLEVVEAYVIHPDGTKVSVTPDNIFTRTSTAAQDAPGFVSSLTTTVVFPELQVGSRAYVKWKYTQFKPSVLGFCQTVVPPFTMGIKNLQATFILPKTVELNWKERGGFTVKDTTTGSTRTIHAEIKDVSPHTEEFYMASPPDFLPIFIASSIPSWEELGVRIFKDSKSREAITPQIQALSDEIVKGKKEKEAAEAIYNWIAENIQYLAIYLNATQGYISHTAEEILKNGYGDCKDHVTLMRALLKAQNINSYPVLVNWGTQYVPFPLPDPDQFNHEMIYLPQFNLFANPTDKFAPFGVLGRGLDGKFVLIASPEGRTAYLPASSPEQNTYKNISTISLLPDGTIQGKNTLTVTGYMNDAIREIFSSPISLQDLAEKILSKTAEGGYGDFILSGSPFNLATPFSVSGKWTSPQAFLVGETIYFEVPVGTDPLSSPWFRKMITPRNRLFPFVIFPGQYEWIYTIKLPEGYSIAHVPSNIDVSNSVGSFQSTYSKKGENTILVKRKFVINKFYLSPQEYELLRSVLYTLEKEAHSIFGIEKKK